MSTSVQPTPDNATAPAPPPDSATSPTSAAGAGSPPASPEYRYPADYKIEYLRGRTAEEAAAITDQLAGALRGYVQSGTPTPTPQAPAAPATEAPTDQYVTAAEARRYADPIVSQMANLALDTVKQRNAEIFRKYGPEVDVMLSRVQDRALWTVDNLQQVCDIVKGRHVDEIARDMAARLVPTMEPTLRSTGAAAVPVTAQGDTYASLVEKLSPEQRSKFDRAAVTENTVREWCASTGQTVEQFFKPFFRGQVITEAPRR